MYGFIIKNTFLNLFGLNFYMVMISDCRTTFCLNVREKLNNVFFFPR